MVARAVSAPLLPTLPTQYRQQQQQQQQPSQVPQISKVPDEAQGWRAALGLIAVAAAIENTMTLAMFSVESLTAEAITGDADISTLPTTARLLGATLSAAPASFLMGRSGRRTGFVCGGALAVVGTLICALAAQLKSFPLLIVGSVVCGSEGGFSGFLRFAAAEVVSVQMRPRAISWTIAASIVAGVLGPHFAQVTRALLPTEFVATYLGVGALATLFISAVAGNSGLPGPAGPAGKGRAGDECTGTPVDPGAACASPASCTATHGTTTISQNNHVLLGHTTCALLQQPAFMVALMAQVGGNAAMVSGSFGDHQTNVSLHTWIPSFGRSLSW